MKKTLAKLTLHRETLRHLETRALRQARGADFPTLPCPSAGNTCDLTCDLCITNFCETNNCS